MSRKGRAIEAVSTELDRLKELGERPSDIIDKINTNYL